MEPQHKEQLTLSECLEIREKYMHQSYNAGLNQIWNQPIYLKSGEMQYVFDENNKKYLDLVAGICTVSCGHANPRINEVLKVQSEKLWHCTNVFVRLPHNVTKVVGTRSHLSQTVRMAILYEWKKNSWNKIFLKIRAASKMWHFQNFGRNLGRKLFQKKNFFFSPCLKMK